jgi:hypothetical protein
MDADEEPPDPGPTVEIEVVGVKQLKGITTEMAIFSCRKKADTPQSEEKHSEDKSERKHAEKEHTEQKTHSERKRSSRRKDP